MKYFTLAFLWILIPTTASAAVYITEVAWMGTAESQYSEWLELYNDGESSVNLSGWKLYEGDGTTLVFTLTKTISAKGYLLIERTTASAPDAVPGINDESGSFGGGGFANTGEDLVLKNNTGEIVDELNFLDGWPAGDASTKQTMQLQGGKWITAKPTPNGAPSGTGEVGATEASDTSHKEVNQTDPSPIPKVSPNKPQIVFTIPALVYKGVPYEFAAEPLLEYNYKINLGKIYWNFGDGTAINQHTVTPVTHTYEYPGTYTMYYSYNDSIIQNTPLTGTKKIKVLDTTLKLAMKGTTAVELNNAGTAPLDLSGWNLVVGSRSVSLPPSTIIAEKSNAVIPLRALGLSSAASATLIDPTGTLAAQTETSVMVGRTVQTHSTREVLEDTPTDSLVAEAAVVRDSATPQGAPIRNRTKTIIFGAVALFVIGLSILLERAMARREY